MIAIPTDVQGRLHSTLTTKIQEWIESIDDDDNKTLGYFGDATAACMAHAGMAVLMAQSDINNYHQHEGTSFDTTPSGA